MTISTRIAGTMRSLGGLVVILLLLAQLAVVTLRYIFSLGWPWALDLLVYCFFLAGVFPLLFVLIMNVSIRVDIFYSSWSKERCALVDRFALGLLLCPSMAYGFWSSLGSTVRSWQVLETTATFGGLPGLFLLKSALTAAFGLLALFAGALACKHFPYGTGQEES